jgi:tetratricopeptide (TPR) repeat protein
VKDHPIFGVGPNRFAAVYNNYQSEYFKKGSSSVTTKLLADNTFEAFNSIIQILVEYGIIGLLFLIWFAYRLVRNLLTHKETANKEWLRIGSIGCIASVFISSLFSNPFHLTPVLLIFIYHLSVVLPKPQPQHPFPFPSWRNYFVLFFVVLFGSSVCYFASMHHNSESKWYRASELAQNDDFTEAKKLYEEAYPVLRFNGDFLFNYGAEAFLAHDYTLSIKLLERSKKYSSASNIFIYLGNNYTEVKQFTLAEKNYLHAIYMIPSHIYPKYQLIKLYKKWDKLDQAKYWINEAMQFPVKVKSQLSDAIIKELKTWQ